jgi:hypothetical protein
MENHEGFWLFDIENDFCQVGQGFFDADKYAYIVREINLLG